MELNLKANTPSEQKILEYLQNNASETLADKINNGTPFEKDGKPLINKKTLTGFMKYACEEARKTVENSSSSACVEDSVVYGWAVHYFEEESIEGALYTLDGEEYKPTVNGKHSKIDLYAHFYSKTTKSTGFFIRYYFARKQNRRYNEKRSKTADSGQYRTDQGNTKG